MPQFSEQQTKREVRELSRKPILAEGQVRVLPFDVSPSDKEGKPYAFAVRVAPLADPSDGSSTRRHLGSFVNLPIGRHDESHPPAAGFMMAAAVDYVLAAIPGLPQKKRYGPGVTNKDIQDAADAATEAAKVWLVKAWNAADKGDKSVMEQLLESPVFATCKHYANKTDGSTQAGLRYFAKEPNKKYPVISGDALEFLDLGDDVEPAEDASTKGGAARRRRPE